MCRASRTHGDRTIIMTPPTNAARGISYADRLDSLKRVLKPYRDNNANCLRSITRSARVNLNRHWKSLENLFAAAGNRRDDEERAQNAVNEKLENGENAINNNNPTADAIEKLGRMCVDR